MDLVDVLAPLPAANLVKRLVTFCVDDLHLAPHEIALILRRAADVASAVTALSAEADREAATARLHADFDARMAEIAACLRAVTGAGRY